MTRLLKLYALVSAVWAAAYVAALWPLVRHDPIDGGAVTAVAILFTVALTSIENACLRRDSQRDVRYDLRRRYTAVSVIASGTATTVWALGVRHDGALFVVATFATVVAVLAAGALAGRRRIKGLTKDQLFS